jgi:hypothetical protein
MAASQPVNQTATRVARDYGPQFALRGPVVIVGTSREIDTIVAIGLTNDQIDGIRRRNHRVASPMRYSEMITPHSARLTRHRDTPRPTAVPLRGASWSDTELQ